VVCILRLLQKPTHVLLFLSFMQKQLNLPKAEVSEDSDNNTINNVKEIHTTETTT